MRYNKLFNFKSIYILRENVIHKHFLVSHRLHGTSHCKSPIFLPSKNQSQTAGNTWSSAKSLAAWICHLLVEEVDGFKNVLLQNMRLPWKYMVFIGVY